MGAPRLGFGSTFGLVAFLAGTGFLVRFSARFFVNQSSEGWLTDNWMIAAVGIGILLGFWAGLGDRYLANREQEEWWPKVGMVETLWEQPVLNAVLEYQDTRDSSQAELLLVVTPKGETAKSYYAHYVVFTEARNPIIRERRKYEMSEKTGLVHKTDTVEFATPAGFLNATPVIEMVN